MTKLSIKVRGTVVRQGLENLSAELPQIGRRRLRTMMNRVVRTQQAYPQPEPAHRTKTGTNPTLGKIYTRSGRTGAYGNHWEIKEIDNGYAISNDVMSKGGFNYAIKLGGDAYGGRQAAWASKYGWKKTRDVVEVELEKLPPEIEQDIIMVARRDGLQ